MMDESGKLNGKFRLGDLQLRIMKVLWDIQPASVATVHQRINDKPEDDPLAYTTIATMLRKMELRRLVRHNHRGRRFMYEAAVNEQDVTRSMSDDLVQRLFEGNLSAAVSHLLKSRDVSLAELDELESLILQQKRRQE